jgi:Raf kinase inhibitor-like YbhB/YbcL family protein
MALTLSSSSFSDKGSIPAKFTCDGKDQSPPLAWDGVPDGTKSFALIVDDPDAPDPKAPKRVWVHWVLYNIPAETRQIAEASAPPAPTRDGKNDWGKTGYGGPCPPIGRHRYFFKLYALDAMLPDLGTPTKAELEKAMQGHVLEKVEIIGTYERPK